MVKALSNQTLSKEILIQDKKECKKYGPCGVGKKALYLNSFYLDRIFYIPFTAVIRVFKRVAMSKGGYTGKGIFATMPYLVVIYDNGVEKQFLFKHEEHVDEMLAYINVLYPDIPLISEEIEKKRKQKAVMEISKPIIDISDKAKKEIKKLENAKDFLEERPALFHALSRAAKAKRVNECSNPMYRWVALIIVLLGIAAAIYGIWAVITKAGLGMYFLLFGFAAVFLFAGANVLPTKQNNKKYIEEQWKNTCDEMQRYIKNYNGFPLPACYSHPITIIRMIRILKEGLAENAKDALEMVKIELKSLNADVTVEQDEYDEIMTIKPMFLIENYK